MAEFGKNPQAIAGLYAAASKRRNAASEIRKKAGRPA
jgi:hypothetical protein